MMIRTISNETLCGRFERVVPFAGETRTFHCRKLKFPDKTSLYVGYSTTPVIASDKTSVYVGATIRRFKRGGHKVNEVEELWIGSKEREAVEFALLRFGEFLRFDAGGLTPGKLSPEARRDLLAQMRPEHRTLCKIDARVPKVVLRQGDDGGAAGCSARVTEPVVASATESNAMVCP